MGATEVAEGVTGVPYDWSTDPELVELLLDPYRSGGEALLGAVRVVLDTIGPPAGGEPENDGCPTCVIVAACRQAAAGWALLVGSEER
jgi:hypothetical protein